MRFESAVGLISVMVNWNGESLRVLRTKMFGISAQIFSLSLCRLREKCVEDV